jgi:hypothetical protein
MRSILLAGAAGLLLCGGAMAQGTGYGSMSGGTSAGSMSSQGSMGTPGMGMQGGSMSGSSMGGSMGSPGMMPAAGANDRLPQRDIPGEVSRGPAANAPVNDRRHMREAQSQRYQGRRSTRPEDQAYMGGGMILENGRPVGVGPSSGFAGAPGMMGPSGTMSGGMMGGPMGQPSGAPSVNRGQDPYVGFGQVQPGPGGPIGTGQGTGRNSAGN